MTLTFGTSPGQRSDRLRLLRKETGASLLYCNQALIATGWDMNLAKEWLKTHN